MIGTGVGGCIVYKLTRTKSASSVEEDINAKEKLTTIAELTNSAVDNLKDRCKLNSEANDLMDKQEAIMKDMCDGSANENEVIAHIEALTKVGMKGIALEVKRKELEGELGNDE